LPRLSLESTHEMVVQVWGECRLGMNGVCSVLPVQLTEPLLEPEVGVWVGPVGWDLLIASCPIESGRFREHFVGVEPDGWHSAFEGRLFEGCEQKPGYAESSGVGADPEVFDLAHAVVELVEHSAAEKAVSFMCDQARAAAGAKLLGRDQIGLLETFGKPLVELGRVSEQAAPDVERRRIGLFDDDLSSSNQPMDGGHFG
jgi:hypothetical protein